MDRDYIDEAVFQFLDNGSDLPPEASKNAETRFMFQSAMSRQTYQMARCAVETSNVAKKKATDVTKAQENHEKVIDTKVKSLVDKVNVRLGLVGGMIVVANVVLFYLANSTGG